MKLGEYLRKEQKKISGFTARQKVEYILEYYWLWILGLVLGIGAYTEHIDAVEMFLEYILKE